jgi:aspartyl-tRNA(Asn)/glutamyl-tRNA(Gln) amidotransferase subunit A
MARSTGDARALLDAVRGCDPSDPATLGNPEYAPGLTGDSLAGVRIGLFAEALGEPTTPEIAGAVRQAAEHLRAAGATVTEAAIPGFIDEALTAHGTIMWAEDRHLHRQWYPAQKDKYSAFLRERFDAAAEISAVDYLAALEERKRLQARIREAMTGFDALLMPNAPFPATPLETAEAEVEEDRTAELIGLGWLNSPFNLSGQPAVTLPVALSPDGLPLGVQLVGRHFEDARLLDIAAGLETLANFRPHRTAMLRGLQEQRI